MTLTRFFAPVPLAIAAILFFAACVDLTTPWERHKDAGDAGGSAAAETGGSGGSAGSDAAIGGSGGSAAAGGTATGGIDGPGTTGGAGGTANDGAAGNVALDAGAVADATSPEDGGIDVPFSGDTNLPVDQGTGGTRTGGVTTGGTGGTRTGGVTTGGTGGTATGGAGGTLTVDAGIKADATPSGDGKIDVPFSGDTSPPSDLGAGGSDGAGTGGAGGTGGTATGGAATGGTATGGAATGGTSTGGTATGGTATGGSTGPMIISIRFVGGRPGGAPGTTTMAAAESAGFKPATNWNSAGNPAGTAAANATGSLSSLVAADGSTTTASITWNAPATYTVPFNDTAGDAGAALGDAHMMNGFLEAQDTTSVTIGMTLPSSMSGAYDVYVYCYGNINATTRTYRYTIGSTTHDVSQTGHSVALFSDLGGHSPALAPGGPDGGPTTGTYILFQNVTGTTFTLTATPLSSTALPTPILRAPVNGIQIVYPAGS